MFRWPNGYFDGLDVINVLQSTCTVNPNARIDLSPHILGWPLARVSDDPVPYLVDIGNYFLNFVACVDMSQKKKESRFKSRLFTEWKRI